DGQAGCAELPVRRAVAGEIAIVKQSAIVTDGVDHSVVPREHALVSIPATPDLLRIPAIGPNRIFVLGQVLVEDQCARPVDGIDDAVSSSQHPDIISPTTAQPHLHTHTAVRPGGRPVTGEIAEVQQSSVKIDGVDNPPTIVESVLEGGPARAPDRLAHSPVTPGKVPVLGIVP